MWGGRWMAESISPASAADFPVSLRTVALAILHPPLIALTAQTLSPAPGSRRARG